MKFNFSKFVTKQSIKDILDSYSTICQVVIDIKTSSIFVTSEEAEEDLALEIRYPIEADREVIGWTLGHTKAKYLADLLSHLATAEKRIRSLARDTLERYEEIGFLHEFTSKLASCHGIKAITDLALQEAQQLVKGSTVSLMLYHSISQLLELVEVKGEQDSVTPRTLDPSKSLIGAIFRSGKAEIINDVTEDPRHSSEEAAIYSLICCPLITGRKVIGVLNVSHKHLLGYTNKDLILIDIISSQTAAAIENSRFYEQKLIQEKLLNQLKDNQAQDLRTPFTNIKVATQMVKVTSGDQQAKYLTILESECERGVELINKLLEIKHLES